MQWHSARARVQLRLAAQRIHMQLEKKNALAKRARYEAADLVHSARIDTARIRTENMILDDVFMELLELLELYAETVSARFTLLEREGSEPEAAIAEQVNGLMYAAPHTEVRELHVLRELLAARYGKDYAAAVAAGENVPERITSRLKYTVPPPELVDAYLTESASAADSLSHIQCTIWRQPAQHTGGSTRDRDRIATQ